MFNIKVYDQTNSFLFTQDILDVTNDLSYTGNTNGGQWRNSMSLAIDIDKNVYEIWYYVEITEYNEMYKVGRLYYKWIVESIELISENSQETVSINMFGIADCLNKLVYQSAGRKFTKTGDPATIISNIVTYFNATFPVSLFTVSPTLYGSSISIEFDNKSCFDALTLVCEKIGWYWYAWPDGVITAKAKSNWSEHTFTYKYDVESMKIILQGEDMTNRLYLDYTWGSSTYNNASSQTSYFLEEKVENKTDIQNLATANDYGNKKVADDWLVKKQISLTINTKYDIWSIKPWDTCRVQNSKYPVANLQILKINRSKDKIILDIDRIQNAGTLGALLLK